MAQEKAELIYIGDPMCSWCYGFSTEISRVVEELKGDCNFQLVMGGLRPYNTETMADLGDFLKEHWEHVADRSDVVFNYDILGDKSFVYDTEPPARAVVTVRSLHANLEFEFFHAVQKTFYTDNKNTNDIKTYLEILPQFGIDKEAFIKIYESDEMKEAVKADYKLCRSMGIQAFPSTVLKSNGLYYKTSDGFLRAEDLISNIRSIIDSS